MKMQKMIRKLPRKPGRTATTWLTLIVLALIVAPVQAGTLTIVPTYNDASFIADGYSPTTIHTAFQYVITEYENRFTGAFNQNVHVNINVQATTATTVLGQSNSVLLGFFNYANTRNALLNDYAAFPSTARTIAGANLPVADPTGGGEFVFNKAQAKELGIYADDNSSDGTFTFGKQTYTFDPNNRQVPGAFDWIGVAEQEVSEIMGRIPILGYTGFNGHPAYDINDLFRFTGAGARSLSAGAGIYFSIDNGNTKLAGFNGNPSGDADDYDGITPGPPDPYNAFTGPGHGHALTAADITNMNVIGWNTVQQETAVPEPSSLALLALGGAGLAGYGWRRRKRAVA
jgi:hypothetical protein